MPWLLEGTRPNLHWRVLVELFSRPEDSPAVVRARSGANVVDPVAVLLEDLLPDGSWACPDQRWDCYRGTGWRLIAAVQFGADPTDPRLHAAWQRMLDEAEAPGGFGGEGRDMSRPWLTARLLQALGVMGWGHHARFQEALAWLDEAAPRAPGGGWLQTDPDLDGGTCLVTPVALLDGLTSSGITNRSELRERAIAATLSGVVSAGEDVHNLAYPNFDRTDLAEALAVLARAGAEYEPRMRRALVKLQNAQHEGGRWSRDLPLPENLPIGRVPGPGFPSRWVSLRAAGAILRYAVDAGLPRKFPAKPA